MIDFKDVSKHYEKNIAVLRANFRVEAKELFVLLGESGSGKTTLLKMVNRLIEPTHGAIFIDGKDAKTSDPVLLRRSIGYVIQQVGLMPHWTIGENIALVPKLLGWAPAEIEARVTELLTLIGLPGDRFLNAMPDELSGGQRQRVGIARALSARPKVLLMDEPLGAVDPILRKGLGKEIARIHKETGLTTLMVTHDIVEGLTLSDRALVMRGGEILQIGTPSELLNSPAHEYVEELMGVAKDQASALSHLRDLSPQHQPQ